ncbi:hypothetical protein [Nostoc sp. C117]|uniref:hypothetical protein n=1 Tax=Nostoc sp. C117 TaxID=3349875 RepID=UPI00370D9700
MTNSTEKQKQKYARFQEILEIGKHRYVNAGGNPQRYRVGFKGQDYLTDEERKEATKIMRQMFGISITNGYIYCQGNSLDLPENSVLAKEKLE